MFLVRLIGATEYTAKHFVEHHDGGVGEGRFHFTSENDQIVTNHSSYMDALALATVLPGEPAIVAKRELSAQQVAGPLLRRLGVPFVERYDVSGSLADAERLIDLARKGRLLVFFPEGTFTRPQTKLNLDRSLRLGRAGRRVFPERWRWETFFIVSM